MSTRNSGGRQWTQAELAALTVERGFRLRGTDGTRLDTFIDAAFAFVLTLLVISLEDIPANFAEMVTAIKRIPAFAASFAILMLFWLPHRNWSRRYGLENPRTIFLSLTLIFVVMVYVYPLRTLLESMFFYFSGGYLPSSFTIEEHTALRGVFAFYSAGFLALSLLFTQLYRATYKSADMLLLDGFETRCTLLSMYEWSLAAAVSLLSIVLALTLPESLIPAAGYVYGSLFFVMPIPRLLDRRRGFDQKS